MQAVLSRQNRKQPVKNATKIKPVSVSHADSVKSVLQAKLNFGQENDKYEQEADRLAEQITKMPDRTATTLSEQSPTSNISFLQQASSIQRSCAACRAEDELVQKKSRPGPPAELPASIHSSINALQGTGRQLPKSDRNYYEPRFGTDFSKVRLHTDQQADSSARSVNARAFTLGQHIVFATGQYSPGSPVGRQLLAHELTHVIQQGHAQPATENFHQQPVQNKSAVPVIQRLGNLDERPDDLACPLPGGYSGNSFIDIMMQINSSTLSPADGMRIDNLVDNWHSAGANEPVRIDGFASQDGPDPLNWTLSCQRASTVKSALMRPPGGGPGIPLQYLSIFAHGETTEFGSSNPSNRRVTLILQGVPGPTPNPTPDTPDPPTPTPLRVIGCKTTPRQIFTRDGCGSGTDFTHHDFQSISSVGAAGQALVWQADNLSTDFRLRNDMRLELGALGGSEGLRMVTHFSGGTGSKLTHNSSSTLGSDALGSATFTNLNNAVKTAVEAELTRQKGTGTIDCNSLSITSTTLPAVSFSFSDGFALKGIIGGTQGLRIRLTSFTFNATTGRYYMGVQYLICDDFGVDTSDLYSPGLAAFWVLQHRRSGNLPFINELDLPRTLTGIV